MRKVQLTIKQEEVAPATTSDLVVMNNGKTLKEELSTNVLDKFSREVTVNSSMSKIVDGTLDGVYESCVFKGRSLVNLFDKSEIATNHPSYTVGTDNTISFVTNNGFAGGVDLSHLKPNTKYALFFDVLTVSQEPNIPYRINDDGTNYNVNIFGQGQDNPTSGFHSFTTGSDVSNLKFFFYTNLRNVGFKLTLPVIIEYQDGMENWGIPYFDGIGYAKMPILRNVGKNLFNINGYSTKNQYASINGNTITVNAPTTFSNTVYTLTGLKEGELYRVSLDKTGAGEFSIRDANGSSLLYVEKEEGHVSRTFTYEKGATIRIGNRQVVNSELSFANIQIEHGSTETAHESYKSNILRTSEEIVLREVGGVCDTYNPLTGEYVRRIGEVVFDGSEDENWNAVTISPWTENGYYTFEYLVQTSGLSTYDANNGIYAICDKFNSITYNVARTDAIGILLYDSQGKKVAIKQKEYTTLDEWKQYLASNPITVQYQLATPITTIVEPSTIPFAYENGHIILESGFEGQSLLPELKYSAPASKNGVISTTSKAILKHEQRLHKFEDLLLRESLLMDYRLMLTMLDSM